MAGEFGLKRGWLRRFLSKFRPACAAGLIESQSPKTAAKLSAPFLQLMRDLPWGMIRIGERGSPGTHNGAKSVTSVVGTQEFARLRLGCGPDHPVGDLADYVLRPMKKAVLEAASEMVAAAGDAVEMILTQGIAVAMNKYNRRVPPPEEVL